jgi:hypothetical protein
LRQYYSHPKNSRFLYVIADHNIPRCLPVAYYSRFSWKSVTWFKIWKGAQRNKDRMLTSEAYFVSLITNKWPNIAMQHLVVELTVLLLWNSLSLNGLRKILCQKLIRVQTARNTA